MYLQYDTVEAAISAQRAMHLRWFAGRQISVLFMVCYKTQTLQYVVLDKFLNPSRLVYLGTRNRVLVLDFSVSTFCSVLQQPQVYEAKFIGA